MRRVSWFCCFVTAALLPALLSLASNGAHALDSDVDLAQCRLDVWTTKDGLPPRDIQAITQTPDGYLWLGMASGLVRFDGVTFKIFNSRDTPGLRRDDITSLMVTRRGELWIGTNGSGFGPFKNGVFSPYKTGIHDEAWGSATAMLEAQDGTFWIGGVGDRNLLRSKNGQFTNISMSYQDVHGFVEDRQGTLWAANTSAGLWLRRKTGDAIPLAARIVSMADSYSAMITDRPYQSARTSEAALREIKRCAGPQFDPAVVEALEQVLVGEANETMYRQAA